MKTFCLIVVLFAVSSPIFCQNSSLDGAWIRNRDTLTSIWIIANGYYMQSTFSTSLNRFVSASGGIFKQNTNSIELEVEFNSANTNDAGNYHLYDFSVSGNEMTTQHHEEKQVWKRLDDGKPGELFGAWLFSGRKTSSTDTLAPYRPGVRKTMKILSGTRFQWAAYNTQTKEFLGTGGGTYYTLGGKYTEKIDVFSRDNNRVGATLEFDMKLEEPHWYHSGKSSKGDMIFERWSRRNSFTN